MAGDLVAVQKEITVGGVAHTHTYWMKPEDAQKEHDSGAGVKTGETKKFSQLEPHEKSTYWKQAAAKAAATKAGPKAKAPEVKAPEKSAETSAVESAIKGAVESSVAAHGDKFSASTFFQGLTIEGQTALGTAPLDKINEWAKQAKAPSTQAKKWMSAGQKAAATKKAKAEAAKKADKPVDGGAELDKILGKSATPEQAKKQKDAETRAAVEVKVKAAIAKFGTGGFSTGKFVNGLSDEEKSAFGGEPWSAVNKMANKLSGPKSAPAPKKPAAASTPSSKSTATLPMVKNAISHDMTDEERAAVRKSALPPGDFKSAMKAAGANDHEAEKMKDSIDSWSGSSSSDSAMRIRGAAVAAMFPNDPDKAKSTFEAFRDHPNAAGYSYAGTGQKQKMEQGFSDPKVVATVVASAKVAQSMYDEEYITVYRGVKGGLASKVKNMAHESGSTEVDFDVHALSCWSESPHVAKGFAGSGGVVVAMKIHRSSIAASHRVPGTGISSGAMGGKSGSYGKEKEVFVASTGTVRAQIWHG